MSKTKTGQSGIQVTRRQALQGSAAAVAATFAPGGLLGLTGCGGDSAVRPPAKVRKDLHFSFGGKALGPEGLAGDVYLRVGTTRYKVAAHDAASLATLRQRKNLADGPLDDLPVLYATDVLFSAEGVQSYHLEVPTRAGHPIVLTGGIHIPTAADVARLNAPLAEEDDPQILVTPEDAAVWALFHDPALMAHDAEVAQPVVDHLYATASFGDLVDAIAKLFYATTPEQHAEGYVGWINGEYALDQAGKKIPLYDLNGDVVVDDKGAPGYVHTWSLAEPVQRLVAAVTGEAKRRFHDDPSLEGIRYFKGAGQGGAADIDVAGLQSGGHEDGPFVCHENGKSQSGRTFHVEAEHEASRYKVKLANDRALGAGVAAVYSDGNGTFLGSRFLGYIPATYYPGISRIFGPSEGEFAVDGPAGTAKIDILAYTFGLRAPSERPVRADPRDSQGGAQVASFVAIFLDLLVDFVMPGVFLSIGLGGHTAERLNEELLKDLLEESGIDLIVDLVKSTILTLVNLGGRPAEGVIHLFAELGVDALKTLLNVFTSLIFKGKLLAIIAPILTAAAGASALEGAIPFFGWAVKALGIAQTVAQLATAGYQVVTTDTRVDAQIIPSHTVVVTARPDPEDRYFPAATTKAKVTVTASGRAAITEEHDVPDPNKPVTVRVERVPLGGQVTVAVSILDARGKATGAGSATFTNGTERGKEQEVDVFVKGYAAEISTTSTLLFSARLAPTGAGYAWQQASEGAKPPTDDDTALSSEAAKKRVSRFGPMTLDQAGGVFAYGFEVGDGTKLQWIGQETTIEPPSATRNLAGAQLIHSLGGVHCVVAATSVTGPLGVYAFDPKTDRLATFDAKQSEGRLLDTLYGTTLLAGRIHPGAHAGIFVTNAGVEVVHLLPARPTPIGLCARFGSREGFLGAVVAAAALPDADGYLVLEQDTKRIQAFDFSGNPLARFGRDGAASSFPLASAADGREYLDLDVDGSGYAWVLSIERLGGAPARFRMEVYTPTGALLFFSDDPNRQLRAFRFALDRFRTIFAANAENVPGPAGTSEPTLSRWYPQ